jgi:hypothetical protein
VGLLTFAALATVALLIGFAATKRPCRVEPCGQQEQPAEAPSEDLSGGSAVGALPHDSDRSAPEDPAPPPPEESSPHPAAPADSEPADSAPEHSAPAADPQPTPPPPGHAEPAPSPPDDAEAPPSVEAPPADPDQTAVSTPTVDVEGAAAYVRAFYADLEQRNFRAAWPRLAEDLRKRHGSLEAWERGFASTLRQSISDVVAKAAGPATVRVSLTLTAVDRDKHDCETTRRFAVLWRLDQMGGKWRALHAEGKELAPSPAAVAASCSAEEPASAPQSER